MFPPRREIVSWALMQVVEFDNAYVSEVPREVVCKGLPKLDEQMGPRPLSQRQEIVSGADAMRELLNL